MMPSRGINEEIMLYQIREFQAAIKKNERFTHAVEMRLIMRQKKKLHNSIDSKILFLTK